MMVPGLVLSNAVGLLNLAFGDHNGGMLAALRGLQCCLASCAAGP